MTANSLKINKTIFFVLLTFSLCVNYSQNKSLDNSFKLSEADIVLMEKYKKMPLLIFGILQNQIH